MWMAADEFFANPPGNIGHRELPGFDRDLRYKDDFEKKIAQFFTDRVGFALLDRIDELMSFLEDERPQRAHGLLAVPRTPVGSAKSSHDRQKLFELRAFGHGAGLYPPAAGPVLINL